MLLPEGLSSRPLARSDARAVYEVTAAQELADLGEVLIDEAEIASDWQRPSFDVGERTVGVFADERLIGYAQITSADRADTAVHPEFRGFGVGTWLARWTQEKARERGAAVIGVPVPEGSTGDRLLESLGYRVRWTSWILGMPEGSAVPSRALPGGYTVREATDADYRACWNVLEEAFLEWSVREREPYEDFLAEVTQRPGFEAWNLRVVTDADQEIVAVAVIVSSGAEEERDGFVERLATRVDQRGRGLAQALLVDSFAAARANGVTGAALSTDSRTGALGLYEKVGMRVTSTWLNRAIDL